MELRAKSALSSRRAVHAACKIAGVESTTRELNGEDPAAFVLSANIDRRHMTKGQRAMVLAMIYPKRAKGGSGKKGRNNCEDFSLGVSTSSQLLRYEQQNYNCSGNESHQRREYPQQH